MQMHSLGLLFLATRAHFVRSSAAIPGTAGLCPYPRLSYQTGRHLPPDPMVLISLPWIQTCSWPCQRSSLRKSVPLASVPGEDSTSSLVPLQPLPRAEQHPKWPPKNILMQKNIIIRQIRNIIGNIHHIHANGALHQNHIVLPPFVEISDR